mgnify:CR=1 FL=1
MGQINDFFHLPINWPDFNSVFLSCYHRIFTFEKIVKFSMILAWDSLLEAKKLATDLFEIDLTRLQS